jgi:hypothetical protein
VKAKGADLSLRRRKGLQLKGTLSIGASWRANQLSRSFDQQTLIRRLLNAPWIEADCTMGID